MHSSYFYQIADLFCQLNLRYYKVNEVQKFTYSRKRDDTNNEMSVSECLFICVDADVLTLYRILF